MSLIPSRPHPQSPAAMALAWMNADPRPRLLLDPEKHIVWCNQAAEAEVRRGDVLRIAEGRLVAAEPGARATFDRFLRAAAVAPSRHLLPIDHGANHLIVDASALPGGTALRLRRTDTPLPLVVDTLRPLGLTPTELSTLLGLLDGATAAEIGRSAKTSPNTIRVHIKNIYAKLGVASRIELLRRLVPYIC